MTHQGALEVGQMKWGSKSDSCTYRILISPVAPPCLRLSYGARSSRRSGTLIGCEILYDITGFAHYLTRDLQGRTLNEGRAQDIQLTLTMRVVLVHPDYSFLVTSNDG